MAIHKGTAALKTRRLILRRFTLDDAQDVYDSYTSDELVSKWHNLDVQASVQDAQNMLSESIAKYVDPEYYHWAIEYDGRIVGEINFFDVENRNERCEVGYTVGSKWWNHGIATEALTEVIRFAFDEVHFHKVCAQCDAANVGSSRVMQKSGMKLEGLFREHNMRKDGTRNDTAHYATFSRDWGEDNAGDGS